jgi:tRNA (uracil-5-)-methyltransferase TRM9
VNNKYIFDQIAPSWYNYRHWSIFRTELEELAERWQNGKLLNLGCAHGPDFLPFKDGFELYGVDFSAEMLKLAEKYAEKFGFSVELTLADIRRLPYPDASFDRAIAVATYHHLVGGEHGESLAELRRVLKPGAEAFITVWNRGQLYRRYYLFSYGELGGLVKRAGFEVIKSFPESAYRFPVKFFSRNICLLLKRGD